MKLRKGLVGESFVPLEDTNRIFEEVESRLNGIIANHTFNFAQGVFLMSIQERLELNKKRESLWTIDELFIEIDSLKEVKKQNLTMNSVLTEAYKPLEDYLESLGETEDKVDISFKDFIKFSAKAVTDVSNLYGKVPLEDLVDTKYYISVFENERRLQNSITSQDIKEFFKFLESKDLDYLLLKEVRETYEALILYTNMANAVSGHKEELKGSFEKVKDSSINGYKEASNAISSFFKEKVAPQVEKVKEDERYMDIVGQGKSLFEQGIESSTSLFKSLKAKVTEEEVHENFDFNFDREDEDFNFDRGNEDFDEVTEESESKTEVKSIERLFKEIFGSDINIKVIRPEDLEGLENHEPIVKEPSEPTKPFNDVTTLHVKDRLETKKRFDKLTEKQNTLAFKDSDGNETVVENPTILKETATHLIVESSEGRIFRVKKENILKES